MEFRSKFGLILMSGWLIASQSPSWAAGAVSAQNLKSMQPVLDPTTPSPAHQASHLYKIHAGVSQEYILGPGDVLSVTDTSEDKPVTAIVPVLPDGTTVTSYTGVIQASGHSLREMNDLVNEEAKKWYVNPQIIVNLAKQRPTQVYLLGELMHPGLYTTGGGSAPMPSSSGDSEGGSDDSSSSSSHGEGAAQTQSTLTISGALQMAGGLKESADVKHLRVTRLAPRQTFNIDLWKLMIDGDVSEDLVLQPGDVVYVPKGGSDFPADQMGMLVNNHPKVRVLGSVKAPGLLAMSPDDDVLSAISKAGGFETTAVTKEVILARVNRDGTVSTEKINIKKGLKDGHSAARQKVKPGDIIMVKRSASKTVGVTVGRSLPNLVMSAVMYSFMYRLTGSSSSTTK